MSALTLRSVSRLSEVDKDQWDCVANPAGAPYDPFLSWNFLQALEESGSAVEETGWGPRHFLVEDEAGELVGALPLYLKTHSQGEYVFDFAWADAFERAGGRYYPKLLTAVPFTPVTGRRVLAEDPGVRHALIAGVAQTAQQWEIGTWHVTFPDQDSWDELGEMGLLKRMDRQFIWRNRDYASYDDFLADLSSRKRKALKKERREAQERVEIERLTGDQLNAGHWDVFFECYQDTGARKWGTPYLDREFFDLIHQRMPEDILLVMAKAEGRYVASALNFIGSDALYGRYWGRLGGHKNLHFELCYHQAVEYAIEHGLKRVEAGAQGEHKLARGYRPEAVYSAHLILDPGFRDALENYLERERAAIAEDIALQHEESPFKIQG